MEVKLSHGLFANRRNGPNNRRKRVEELLQNKEDTGSRLAQFKITPEVLPVIGFTRPIPIACRSCVQSSGMIVSERNKGLGVQNCFYLENMNDYQPWHVRLMPHFFHFWELGKQMSDNYSWVEPKDLMNEPSISAFLDRNSGADGNDDNQQRSRQLEQKRIEQFVQSFGQPFLGKRLMKLFERFRWWILGRILAFMFEGVTIHKAEVEMLRDIHEKHIPIIYLPLYRSNFDSFVLSWTLVNFGMPPAIFMTSHKLQKSRIRYFYRMLSGLGCLEKRKGTEISPKRPEISAAVCAYFSALLKNGNSVQFVLESNRSRNGMARTQLVGIELLTKIVELLDRKEIEDAYIVPLSINYDILPDSGMLSKESTNVSLFTRAFNFLTRRLGIVRINISQPFRLREFQQGILVPNVSKWTYRAERDDFEIPISTSSSSLLTGDEIHWDDDRESCASVNSVYCETDNALPSGAVEELTKKLAHHCIYDSVNTTVFMSTQMVAFLLFYKFSEGASLELLIDEMEDLKDYINDHKRDVGFCGDMEYCVLSAINLLGPSLVCSVTRKGETLYKPVLTGSSLTKLRYYANHVTQIFGLESIIATALFSIIGDSYVTHLGTDVTIPIEDDQLIKTSVQICQLFKGEFTFYPLCKTTEEVVRDAIDSMKDQGLIDCSMRKVYYEADEDDFFAGHPSNNVSTEQLLEIKLSKEVFEKLQLLRNLTRPILELYVYVIEGLRCLIPTKTFNGDMEESKLHKLIVYGLERLCEQGVIAKTGIIEAEFVRNAISNLTNMEILGCYYPDVNSTKCFFHLGDTYCKLESLKKLSRAISSYCTY